ncbi:MAG: hemerythrin domain-containing protein [Candidatus Omnitrophica bacterium]|nr:hemerythrin domain-containing protein [Candidatus Omnitrophota bacterium]
MLAIGLLMKEHRLIERMIKLIDKEVQEMKGGKPPDGDFIDTAVDFIKMYADRCHHGKEEDILFRDLGKKNLSPEHKSTMEQLIKGHIWGRETVRKLVDARSRYVQGDQKARDEIIGQLEKLVKFYPPHIEKEDKHFFLPCMDYFTGEEKEAMLKECYDFDQKLIHEKYKAVVEKYEEGG